MTLRTATRRAFLYPAAAAAASGWWLASGTIAESAVEDYGTDVAPGTTYAGNTIAITNPWTIAVQVGTYTGVIADARLFQSGSNPAVYYQTTPRLLCNFDGGLKFITTLNDNDVYFFVCNGTNISGYTNNGVLFSDGNDDDIDASMRYGSDNAGTNQWHENLPKVAVYNIALDATQRAALYASMTA